MMAANRSKMPQERLRGIERRGGCFRRVCKLFATALRGAQAWGRYPINGVGGDLPARRVGNVSVFRRGLLRAGTPALHQEVCA